MEPNWNGYEPYNIQSNWKKAEAIAAEKKQEGFEGFVVNVMGLAVVFIKPPSLAPQPQGAAPAVTPPSPP